MDSKVTHHTQKTGTTLSVSNNFKPSEAVNVNSTNLGKVHYDGYFLKSKPLTADATGTRGRRNQLKT